MAPSSPQTPMKAMKSWSDSETLVLGQSPRSPRSPRPELRRSKASSDLGVNASPKTPVMKSVKGSPESGRAVASPSKSAKTSPQSSKKSVGMASPKPKSKAVQKGQSKGSLTKGKAMVGKRAMRKPAAKAAGRVTLRDMQREKASKWHDLMCEIQQEYDDMVCYNKSFNVPPPCTWRQLFGITPFGFSEVKRYDNDETI